MTKSLSQNCLRTCCCFFADVPKMADNPASKITKNTQAVPDDKSSTVIDDSSEHRQQQKTFTSSSSATAITKQRKCAKLDELLKNHVTFTPYNSSTKQESTRQRQNACTKQVRLIVIAFYCYVSLQMEQKQLIHLMAPISCRKV